ncbi:MAG: (d)CMP kinase [Spongiibacteraceae bacterium]|nr:(d)CMP kinase [Spongiibacteraceae bacterium]
MTSHSSGSDSVPIITIDGPSGSGKGTLCQMLARELGWHLLDSGALYRIVGLAAVKQGVSFDDETGLAVLAEHLNIEFQPGKSGEPALVILDNEDVSRDVRSELSGGYASKVAVFNAVRDVLNHRQKAFAVSPGLVADGRDMGTVVFPSAPLKFYLTASAEKRAERRYKQLINKGESVTLAALLDDIRLRDERDMNRRVAPLKPAVDATILDSTTMSIDAVFKQVFNSVKSYL